MDLQLTGHRALITGSSSGVGAAIASTLAREGCSVLVHGRRREPAEQVAAEIRAAGGHAEVVLGDLTDREQRAAVVAAAQAAEIDILVANAGPFRESSWDEVDPERWAWTFETNVHSTAALIAALLPRLTSTGWGRVITVGSRATDRPLPTMVDYSAAKSAVVSLTRSLASHLSGTGVTANCVSPGVILTPSLQQMFLEREPSGERSWDDIEPEVTRSYAPNPAGRLGRPEDIAAAVAFLASPAADYVNAVELRVDGGIGMISPQD